MHDITEHNTEKEWDSDASEYTWICLLIIWNTISIHNLLENETKLILTEICWSNQFFVYFTTLNVNMKTCRIYLLHILQELIFLVCWYPRKTNLKMSAIFEHIKNSVNSFLSVKELLVYVYTGVSVKSKVAHVVKQGLFGVSN